MDTTLLIFTLLITKHFIVDFPLQVKYQWSNKGTYGHPGGLLHAGLHGVGTWICFLPFSYIAVWLAVADAVIHYHIDWAKMNINAKLGFKADTHEEFWWLLGLDQLLHYLTYIGLLVWHLETLL
jgi:hypothetical protein